MTIEYEMKIEIKSEIESEATHRHLIDQGFKIY